MVLNPPRAARSSYPPTYIFLHNPLGREWPGVRARHRRKQRRAAHVIVVDQLVPLHVHLHHSVARWSDRCSQRDLSRSSSRQREASVFVLRFESSFWMSICSSGVKNWPHERPNGRHRRVSIAVWAVCDARISSASKGQQKRKGPRGRVVSLLERPARCGPWLAGPDGALLLYRTQLLCTRHVTLSAPTSPPSGPHPLSPPLSQHTHTIAAI